MLGIAYQMCRKVHVPRLVIFFCGLYLVDEFAECATPILKEFEALHPNSGNLLNEIETEFHADENEDIPFSKFDGKVLTFLTFCAKCFARGVDEKSGCFSDFKPYCTSRNQKNHFISFRGNRSMLYFLWENLLFIIKIMYMIS
jgi:hypothetical protein